MLQLSQKFFSFYIHLFILRLQLICSLLIILIGLDNLILRDDFNSIRIDIDPTIKNVKNLTDVSKMRNKGNVIKLIESNAPFQSMLCNSFDSDIRNAIGHFSYETSEVTGSYGQIIRFYNINNLSEYIDKSLVQICYDIWQMYKSLGIFNELLYRIEIQIQASDNKYLSLCSDMCDILSPLALMLRSGSFSLNATNVASINELSPYALRFCLFWYLLVYRCKSHTLSFDIDTCIIISI